MNKQKGCSRLVACPLAKALPQSMLEELGLVIFLDGWMSWRDGGASGVEPWIVASPFPLEGRIPPLHLRPQSPEDEEKKKDKEKVEEVWLGDDP